VTVTARLDPEVQHELAIVRELADTATRASNQAAAQRAALARRLHDEGLTVRDIGQIMGVSYQRAAQLITGSKPPRTRAS
jgi:DNA-directed RNA polymerase specialized sigma24 family protein